MFGIGSVIPVDGKHYELRMEYSDSYIAFNVDNIRDRVSVPKQRMQICIVK